MEQYKVLTMQNWIQTPQISTSMPNLAIYGSHNASLVLEHNKIILEVIEFERIFNVKNIAYCQYIVPELNCHFASLLSKYIEDQYGFKEFGTVLYQHCNDSNANNFERYFPAKNYEHMRHHEAHIAGTFYQSSFENAIGISFDGGGNDGFFNIYRCERENGLSVLNKKDIDLGFAYMIFGHYIKDIHDEPSIFIGALVYAGKVLGYQSYGTCRPDWYGPIKSFYLSKPNFKNYKKLIKKLGRKIGLVFDDSNKISGEDAYNLAATSQRVFEDIFFELAGEWIEKYDLPICMSGGCALNIVLNSAVKKRYGRQVFIGCAPNDSGIATGMMLHCMKPSVAYDVSTLGIKIVDEHILPREIVGRKATPVSISEIVDRLCENKIIGIVQGRSEHGPRALGNRSIICSSLSGDMKDILNKKVKNREYYRPFAPMVRLEDVSEYFELEESSEYMSFCVNVKEEFTNVLLSVTHIDGTARVQTIRREQNELMYDILSEFKDRTGIGVLVNTSFNVNGLPILSSYSDALKVFDTTELDCLYLDGYFFEKHT